MGRLVEMLRCSRNRIQTKICRKRKRIGITSFQLSARPRRRFLCRGHGKQKGREDVGKKRHNKKEAILWLQPSSKIPYPSQTVKRRITHSCLCRYGLPCFSCFGALCTGPHCMRELRLPACLLHYTAAHAAHSLLLLVTFLFFSYPNEPVSLALLGRDIRADGTVSLGLAVPHACCTAHAFLPHPPQPPPIIPPRSTARDRATTCGP